MVTINLINCCEKVLILINIWMIWKNSMKFYYLKKKIYNHLDMGDITDTVYVHGKGVCTDFEIKYLGEYNDFYVQSNILLLADVFESFKNMCLDLELDPARFLSAPGLAW